MLRRTLALAVAAALALPAGAQWQRNFTNKALRGELVVGNLPEATLNGKAIRLAPGVRIRDEGNLVQMPVTLVGRKLVVNYTLDLEGGLLEAWVLTQRERDKKPWPVTEKEAQTWAFDMDSQTWTKK